MADIRNDREREELHKAIWSIADDLRGSVDGWDFKQYVLGVMFYRYISENLTNYINEGEHAAGDAQFDYAKMKDSDAEGARAGLVQEKGFFILPSELFCNVRARATDDENLNETLERVFNNIEDSAKGSESEDDFAGLFDDLDVNSNKLGATVAKRNEKLVKLLNGVADMKLRYKDNTIDAFGDAYEYLMSMYASNAGKSGGEFFTPQEVSELLTRIAVVGKTEVNKVYDPACGSGSLLLKAARILGKENIRQGFFGQEINLTTYNLCRINMFLHDIGYDKFNIANEDTLISPQHWDDEPFEVIVSNPPYSIKWAGDENPLLINDPRFSPAGVLAPKSKADLAFIMHSLSWLATNGTAAIVCFPGIMYRGGAEKKIRKYLVDNNFIDCIIQLPSNLFYGTSIATCIMVLKKNKANKRFVVDKLIADNGFDALKKQLAELLYGTVQFEKRWNTFLKSVKGMGPSTISELLTYTNPNEYILFNKTTILCYSYLDVPDMPKYNYQYTGKKFAEVCAIAKEISSALKAAGAEDYDLLAVDYFLWDEVLPLAEKKEPGNQAPVTVTPKTASDSKSLHDEIKEKLVAIGELLGFESRSEVKITTGAVVDAVWEAKIGNMGKAIYVFEVQSKGSIDSLILNLKKAQSNAAVQAVVAVADEEQLAKIIRESVGVIDEKFLRTWNSDDVLAVYDSLARAHESINKLALVPESF